MVGRELLTMCPNGEDHPGHDCREVKEHGLHNSRGPNMMTGLKNWKPTMMVCTALVCHKNTAQKDLLRMNCVSME